MARSTPPSRTFAFIIYVGRRACAEIARVLKPGGVAVISDLFFTRFYAAQFRAAGLSVRIEGPYVLGVFPPQNIVVARKPG